MAEAPCVALWMTGVACICVHVQHLLYCVHTPLYAKPIVDFNILIGILAGGGVFATACSQPLFRQLSSASPL